jgi:hypothetical protein
MLICQDIIIQKDFKIHIDKLTYILSKCIANRRLNFQSKLLPVKRVALFLRPKAVQQTTTPKWDGFVLPGTGETK